MMQARVAKRRLCRPEEHAHEERRTAEARHDHPERRAKERKRRHFEPAIPPEFFDTAQQRRCYKQEDDSPLREVQDGSRSHTILSGIEYFKYNSSMKQLAQVMA